MSDKVYVNSDNIKVFPTSNRDDRYDRNARLNTEQNIVSLVNRLTGNQNFIIDGLEVYDNVSSWYLSAGSCNIGGYYFKLLSPVDLTASFGSWMVGAKLVLSIGFDEFAINEISPNINNLKNTLWYLKNSAEITFPSSSITVTDISFESNNESYNSISITNNSITYGSTTVYSSNSWSDDSYRTIKFGNIDIETQNLISWILNNSASQTVKYLAGNDTIDGYTGLSIKIVYSIGSDDLPIADWNSHGMYWENYNDSRLIIESPMIIDDGQLN